MAIDVWQYITAFARISETQNLCKYNPALSWESQWVYEMLRGGIYINIRTWANPSEKYVYDKYHGQPYDYSLNLNDPKMKYRWCFIDTFKADNKYFYLNSYIDNPLDGIYSGGFIWGKRYVSLNIGEAEIEDNVISKGIIEGYNKYHRFWPNTNERCTIRDSRGSPTMRLITHRLQIPIGGDIGTQDTIVIGSLWYPDGPHDQKQLEEGLGRKAEPYEKLREVYFYTKDYGYVAYGHQIADIRNPTYFPLDSNGFPQLGNKTGQFFHFWGWNKIKKVTAPKIITPFCESPPNGTYFQGATSPTESPPEDIVQMIEKLRNLLGKEYIAKVYADWSLPLSKLLGEPWTWDNHYTFALGTTTQNIAQEMAKRFNAAKALIEPKLSTTAINPATEVYTKLSQQIAQLQQQVQSWKNQAEAWKDEASKAAQYKEERDTNKAILDNIYALYATITASVKGEYKPFDAILNWANGKPPQGLLNAARGNSATLFTKIKDISKDIFKTMLIPIAKEIDSTVTDQQVNNYFQQLDKMTTWADAVNNMLTQQKSWTTKTLDILSTAKTATKTLQDIYKTIQTILKAIKA